MAQSDIVDQNADIEAFNQLLHVVVVGILVLGKVHGQSLDSDLGAILRGDFGGEGV